MATERHNLAIQVQTHGLDKATARLKGLQKTMTSVFNAGAILGFSAIAGTALFQFTKKTLDMAGTLEATERRFDRVFKSLSGDVSGFSKTLADDLGRADGAIKSGLVSFQAFFQGLGFGTKDAAEMSKKMQALSIDLASFFDISDAQSQRRFLAALAGSPEVLDQFGINLKQAALQQELYAMGLNSTVQNTDEMTKSTARLSIIMRAMTDNGIVGDAKRNADNYTNTNKRLSTAFGDQSRIIGKKLLPAYKAAADFVIGLVKANNQMEQAFIDSRLVESFYEKVSKGVSASADETKAAIKLKQAEIYVLKKANEKRIEELNSLSKLDGFKRKSLEEHISNAEKEIAIEQSRLETIKTRAKLQGIINTEELKKTKEIDKNAISELERMRLLQKYREQNISNIIEERDKLKEIEPLIIAASDADGKYNQELQRTQLKLDVINQVLSEITSKNEQLADSFNEFDFDMPDDLSFDNSDFPEFLTDEQISNLEGQISKFDETLTQGIVDAANNSADAALMLKNTVDSMHQSISSSFVSFGYDIVGIILEGGDNMFKAILESASRMALGLSQQLATQAIYHSFRASANYAVGNVVGGAAHTKAAGILAAGAAKLGIGGIAAGLISKSMGGGESNNIRQLNNGQPINLTGQSTFGQTLTAEVDYDKLRFVLNNGQSASFRSNG